MNAVSALVIFLVFALLYFYPYIYYIIKTQVQVPHSFFTFIFNG
jgi:hypothetical protein